MNFKTIRTSFVLPVVAVAVVGFSVWSQTRYTPLEASSHREAPLIADDPLADNTDLYAFRSPDDPSTVTIIANYIPFELPHGGPNYYTFGENIRYEVHVKNDGTTAGDDITYRFTFSRTNEDPTTFFNIRLGQQNLKTTYTCEKSVDGGPFTAIVSNGVVPPNNIGPRSIESAVGLGAPNYESLRTNAIANAMGGGGERIFCGPADDPFFADLGAIFDLANLRPGNPEDGLSRKNVHAIALKIPIATLQKNGQPVSAAANILDSDFVIGVWASASRPQLQTLNGTGGLGATGSYVQVSRLGMPLTNEVINPIGSKDRWNSRTPYDEDVVTDSYLSNPELGLYVDERLFGNAVPELDALEIQTSSLNGFPGIPAGGFDFGNNQDGLFPLKGSPAVAGTALDDALFGNYLLRDNQPRSVDLLPIFHTGVPNLRPYQLATGKPNGNPLAAGKPFINNFLPLTAPGMTNPGGDMLRLNMAVPPTPRNSPAFSNDGLLAAAVAGLTNPAYANTSIQAIPNMDGFPNGRRLEDEVAKIELKAVGGVVLAAIGLWYDDYTPASSSPLTPNLLGVLGFTTGLEMNDTTMRTSFPYVQTPWRGTGPASGPTNQNSFPDQEDNPVISFLAPAQGPVGTTVTINGTNFGGTSSVTFDGVNAPGFTVNGAGTQITVMVPAGATTGTVVVTTPGGVAPSPLYFTVIGDLIVSDERTIQPGTYGNITITGTGVGTLGGGVTVTGAFVIQTGGVFDDGCFVLSGPGSFTMRQGSTLRICHPQGISLTGATGAIQVTGTRSYASDATYIYDGTATQVTGTGLPATVTNLGVENPTSVGLSQALSLRRMLRLTSSGDLTLGSQMLTLLSNSATTALVVNDSTGAVAGTATVQRYITPGTAPGLGYRHLSAPVTNTTFADLATAGFVPRVNPAYNEDPNLPADAFPNIFGFDERREPTSPDFVLGYYSPMTLAEPMVPGMGYSVYMRASSKPDFVGTLGNGNVARPGLTRTGAFLGNMQKSGWHLLGNPYPSPIDWDLATVPAGMSSSISVYKSTGGANGIYLTRANGTGSLPDGLVAMAQGFFARVTGAGPVSFTFTNDLRVTTYENPPHYRTAPEQRPLVGLTLHQAGAPAVETDEAYVYFQAGATAGDDRQFDGAKPSHNQGVPTLVSLTADGTELAVNGLPEEALTTGQRVPLLLDLPVAGTYELAVGQLLNLAGANVTLYDALTNTTVPLTVASLYRFTAEQAGIVGNRFWLNLNADRLTGEGAAGTLALYPNPATGTVRVTLPAGAAAVELLDMTGRVVRRASAGRETQLRLSLTDLPAGVYLVRAGTETQRLVVE